MPIEPRIKSLSNPGTPPQLRASPALTLANPSVFKCDADYSPDIGALHPITLPILIPMLHCEETARGHICQVLAAAASNTTPVPPYLTLHALPGMRCFHPPTGTGQSASLFLG